MSSSTDQEPFFREFSETLTEKFYVTWESFFPKTQHLSVEGEDSRSPLTEFKFHRDFPLRVHLYRYGSVLITGWRNVICLLLRYSLGSPFIRVNNSDTQREKTK